MIDSCLRGAGQTVFANNPIAGSLIIISAFINSPWAGVRSFPLFVLERYLQICARARARVCVVSSLDSEAQVMGLSCLLTSTLTAHYLRTNPAPIRSGLFGYHAWLLGTCIAGRTDCTGRESSLRFLTQCAAFVTKKWDWGPLAGHSCLHARNDHPAAYAGKYPGSESESPSAYFSIQYASFCRCTLCTYCIALILEAVPAHIMLLTLRYTPWWEISTRSLLPLYVVSFRPPFGSISFLLLVLCALTMLPYAGLVSRTGTIPSLCAEC